MTDLHQNRQIEIIHMARTLLAEGGLEALTFSGLERRLPFTRGVITYHFKNRAEIVRAALEHALRELKPHTTAPSTSIDEFLRSRVQAFAEHPQATAVLLIFWVRAPWDPLGEQVNQLLTQGLRKQASALGAHPGLVVGTLLGIVLQHHFDPSFDVDGALRAASELYATPPKPEPRLLQRAFGVFRGR